VASVDRDVFGAAPMMQKASKTIPAKEGLDAFLPAMGFVIGLMILACRLA
jgi:hypothetical protein